MYVYLLVTTQCTETTSAQAQTPHKQLTNAYTHLNMADATAAATSSSEQPMQLPNGHTLHAVLLRDVENAA